ncbi:hypothetical protein [Yinghuangia seranimata]|uniref:hypothetical protein n=1 Tax=Yinghuangia seranimata TaxID=408067 RepID=UPI00248B58DD|nr:hypothetical protein [Yinghuangia seranimata]MDI2131147.1 hypothetical protein [Yinghuangia seranimata]
MRASKFATRLAATLGAVALACATSVTAAPAASAASACGGDSAAWLDANLIGNYDGRLATGESVGIRFGPFGNRVDMTLNGKALPPGAPTFTGPQAGGPEWTWTTVAFGAPTTITLAEPTCANALLPYRVTSAKLSLVAGDALDVGTVTRTV